MAKFQSEIIVNRGRDEGGLANIELGEGRRESYLMAAAVDETKAQKTLPIAQLTKE